jgi:hypothetical protein
MVRKLFLGVLIFCVIMFVVAEVCFASDVEDAAARKSLIQIYKAAGETWVHNGYKFQVMLLVLRLDDKTCNCSCLQEPPIFLKPNERQQLDFTIKKSHLLAFYRFGFSTDICILSLENVTQE